MTKGISCLICGNSLKHLWCDLDRVYCPFKGCPMFSVMEYPSYFAVLAGIELNRSSAYGVSLSVIRRRLHNQFVLMDCFRTITAVPAS